MNARFNTDRLAQGLRERLRLRVAFWRRRRRTPVHDPLPGGIQLRVESEGLLYVEPRAAVRATSVS